MWRAGILAIAADRPALALLLMAWIAVLGILIWRNFRERERWTEERLEITNDFVERMVGHRTRAAQEPRDRWHDGEDEALDHYLQSSRGLDRSLVPVAAVIPRAWMMLSLAMIAKEFVAGSATPKQLAIAFGGVLLAQGALQALTESFSYIAAAVIAWRQVKLLFRSATRTEPAGSPELAVMKRRIPASGDAALIELREVTFRYPDRPERVLNGCNLRVFPGDRILLEGPSGGGKSTFASLLAGLRDPEFGLILFRGLDRRTLGSEAWRQAIACAPQFHDNHVFCGTLAFNLLMGRRWPPRPDDLDDAYTICRELGLGDLLDRMPAGIHQTIGETGWQLSYGERCRLFLARALLQGAGIIILDESFGSLDPETVRMAADCVRRRASTLVMIAHP